MRILVTGASGFLGAYVVAALKRGGAEDIIPLGSKDANLTLQGPAHDIIGWHHPDAVIHLAAQVGGIGANRKTPATFWLENTMMGANVLDACSMFGVKKLVMVGTTCSYPKTPKTIPFVESELYDGYPEETNAAYGIAKRSLIVAASAYRQQFGTNAVTVIPTNLYGPGDNIDPENSHVIPAMIRKMLEAKKRGDNKVTLWGTGKPTRDFLYVEDAAFGISSALQNLEGPLPVNLGSGKEVAMKDLAAMVRKATGFKGVYEWDANKPDGQPRRALDVTRAKDALGWEPRVSLEDGLARTVAWMETIL